MKSERAQDVLERELLTWEGVESRAHRFGGREYRLGAGRVRARPGGRADRHPPAASIARRSRSGRSGRPASCPS